MPRFISRLLTVVCLLAASSVGQAFSLGGPFATWMRQEIGYQIGADLAGPMNLGEEYRWNQRTVTYAYDTSFLNYFGSNGVFAIEAAMKILNDLPSTDALSVELNEFPMDTRRVNYTAQALGLLDLKSLALSMMLEQLGVAVPERWVFTLRERVPIGAIFFYTVIRRNFDPVSLVPTSYVNGSLYTYSIQQTYANPDIFEAVEIAVDPNQPSVTSVASLADSLNGTYDVAAASASQNSGTFYSGLTRDDVAALRYLYRRQNYNVETLGGTPIIASGTGVLGGGTAGVGGGGGPWESPFGGGGGAGGDPWAPAIGAITNAAAGGGGGAAGGGGLAITNFTRPLIDTALRPGVEKLSFVRVNYDSILGVVLNIRNRFADTYITNGAAITQFVELSTTQPDIVFSANDLGLAQFVPITYGRNINFVDQDAINGTETLSGPGNIRGPVVFTFSDIGAWIVNRNVGSGEDSAFIIGPTWGFFDASTNAPLVFPTGTSINDLERIVVGR